MGADRHNGILMSLLLLVAETKKKLELTSFFCLDQETLLDHSWALVYINQSRFYNFFQVLKIKNNQYNSEIL